MKLVQATLIVAGCLLSVGCDSAGSSGAGGVLGNWYIVSADGKRKKASPDPSEFVMPQDCRYGDPVYFRHHEYPDVAIRAGREASLEYGIRFQADGTVTEAWITRVLKGDPAYVEAVFFPVLKDRLVNGRTCSIKEGVATAGEARRFYHWRLG